MEWLQFVEQALLFLPRKFEARGALLHVAKRLHSPDPAVRLAASQCLHQ